MPLGKCAPNADGVVRLRDILLALNKPIREEHAWALCYQCARCFSDALRDHRSRCRQVSDVAHVFLHTDGSVHSSTILPGELEARGRHPVSSEHELVLGLGVVIFNALDMGYSYGEEREISRDLEQLIDAMTSAGDGDDDDDEEPQQAETDDEGIERDAGEADECGSGSRPGGAARLRLAQVAAACGGRAREAHYRGVVRALATEALELSALLARAPAEPSRELDHFHDWSNRRIWRALQARFWVQVVGELRTGVQLRKVDRRRAPAEFARTPYELLMEDIRARRYSLNKVMVDGDVPRRAPRDAHAVILEFIRARPPLRRAADRALPPPPERARTPRELLLDSIRRGRPLRRAQPPHTTPLTSARHEPPRRRDEPDERRPTRRLIKVDFSVLQGDDDDDEDEDDEEGAGAKDEVVSGGSGSEGGSPSPWARAGGRAARITHDEYHHFCDTTLESYDLATQCPTRRASMRRHTVGGCGSALLLAGGSQSVPQSRPASRQSRDDSEPEAAAAAGDAAWTRASLQDELIQSRQWHEAMALDERLSLTLDEIVHIRSVLTKAELEALPVEGRVKADAERRKICFLCLKTRFGLFGPWGQRCRLCKRTVCAKCHTKMRIPTEHFSNVPVVLLSPSLMSSPEDEPAAKDSFPRSLVARLVAPEGGAGERNSVGSAPPSPSLQRAPEPSSGAESPADGRRSARARRADRLKGVQMCVCLDCKMMVLQIIKSSRASRSALRNHAIRNLTLNLSPVY